MMRSSNSYGNATGPRPSSQSLRRLYRNVSSEDIRRVTWRLLVCGNCILSAAMSAYRPTNVKVETIWSSKCPHDLAHELPWRSVLVSDRTLRTWTLQRPGWNAIGKTQSTRESLAQQVRWRIIHRMVGELVAATYQFAQHRLPMGQDVPRSVLEILQLLQVDVSIYQ
jgi:hypothetical protein